MTPGLCVGAFTHPVDVVSLDDASSHRLHGVRCWIVDCLGRRRPPHLDISTKVAEWFGWVRPEKAARPRMRQRLDDATLCVELPDHVVPANGAFATEI